LFFGDGIEDLRVLGTLDFQTDVLSPDSNKRGSIKNAEIHGGSINGMKALEVAGKSYFEGEVGIAGGPFVDVSDQRMKKDIKQLGKGGSILNQLHCITPVTYSLASHPYKII